MSIVEGLAGEELRTRVTLLHVCRVSPYLLIVNIPPPLSFLPPFYPYQFTLLRMWGLGKWPEWGLVTNTNWFLLHFELKHAHFSTVNSLPIDVFAFYIIILCYVWCAVICAPMCLLSGSITWYQCKTVWIVGNYGRDLLSCPQYWV